MATQGPSDRAYLSVLAWPVAAGEDERVELLVRAVGLAPYNARLAARRGVPQVVCPIDAMIAGEVVGALEQMGARSAAPARSAMEAMPPAVRGMRVGRSRANPSQLAVRLRDETTIEIEPAAVSAVLRATVATTRTTIDSGPGGTNIMGAALMGEAEMALAAATLDGGRPRRSVESKALHIVEMQLADGRRYRFDPRAPATRQEGLMPAGERMDRLAVALAEACPGATVDHRFREFRCPPDVLQTASSVTGSRTVTTKDEWPLFEFFSAWHWLVGRRP